MRFFVLDAAGNQYGPADVPTLNQWVTEGRIVATTRLKNEMTGEVVTADSVPGLVLPHGGQPTPAPTPTYSVPAAPSMPSQPGPTLQGPATGDPSRNPYATYNRSFGSPVDTKNALIKAIFSTVCCGCLPLGVVAIVFAIQADSSNKTGNYTEAEQKNKTAHLIGNINIGLGIVIALIYMILAIIGEGAR